MRWTNEDLVEALARYQQEGIDAGTGDARPRENRSRLVILDKALLAERVGKLSRAKVDLLLSGLDIVLGRG